MVDCSSDEGNTRKWTAYDSMSVLTISMNSFPCRMCCSAVALSLRSRHEVSLTPSSPRKSSIRSVVGYVGETSGDGKGQRLISQEPWSGKNVSGWEEF